MEKVMATGVRFKRASKIYNFLSLETGEKTGDKVVVEADKGEDIACVVIPKREIEVEGTDQMKKILRFATENDIAAKKANFVVEQEAVKICVELAQKNELSMKLLTAEFSLDKSKLTFYYTAENRVDFRQLVKDLAKVYHTRIEMRQVGVRDATKVLGGFGICGREFCCASFLKKFDNISIKTIKGHNVAMTHSKISGICGRLMCCLVFEKCCGSQEIIDESGIQQIMVESSEEAGD